MANKTEPITAVRLRRGACFGTCPIYEVTLHSDGTAEWEGERFVDRIGRFHGEFSPNEFEKLASFVERVGFFGWEEENRGNVTDLPDYVLTVVAGKRTKTVLQNGIDEPADFWALAAVVDGVAAGIEWMEGAIGGSCEDWSATLTNFGIVAPLLTVKGVCTFPTSGFKVELRRHRPQPANPSLLLLERIVTAPTGPVAQVITEVEASYVERIASVERVTILPDGVTVDVEVLDAPPQRSSDAVAS